MGDKDLKIWNELNERQRLEILLRIADDAIQRVQNHLIVDNPPNLILSDAGMAARAIKVAREVLKELESK